MVEQEMLAQCPYCNAVLPPLPAAPTTEKAPCPRCGEAVAVARWRVDASAGAVREGLPPSMRPPVDPTTRPGIRQTVYVLLGAMCLMAILALGFALWTTKDRQARHPWMPQKLDPIALRRPLELSGLGHLPKGVQVVVGLHIGEMMDDEKVGKKLLADPRPQMLDVALKQVLRTSGLTLEEIDHVIVGASDLEQIVTVVKTRRKISLEKIAEARPVRSSLHQQLPLYEFALKPAGAALVWYIDDVTLLYVIRIDDPKIEHMSKLSAKARPIEEVLPAPLHQTIKERLSQHNVAWAAGRVDQFEAIKLMLPLVFGARANLDILQDVKTFTLAVAPVEGLTLTGQFHMSDAKSSSRFKKLLDAAKVDGATSQKVEIPPENEVAQWVTWQVRGDVDALRGLMNRGQKDKK